MLINGTRISKRFANLLKRIRLPDGVLDSPKIIKTF